MDKTIVIDPSDLNSMIEVMDRHSEINYPIFGVNALGERTRTFIFRDRIVVYTYQKNGWVRETVFGRDGSVEEGFDGKWKGGLNYGDDSY